MMFKKLHNRMLLMNMSIITVLMLISFSTIYFITYRNIHDTIRQDLYRVSDFIKIDRIPLPKFDFLGNPIIEDSNAPDGRDENDGKAFKEERISAFVIETDADYQMVSWLSVFSTDDTFIASALSNVLADDKDNGVFKLDDSDWAYLIQNRSYGNVISFVDITTQQKVLDRLILTFVVVSVVMLVFIFFISSFLTKRSIQPIKEAFDKQKQFISDASHELKTPLAVIHTNVDVLLANTENQDTKWLNYIKAEVGRMSHLTNDLLYLTQMDSAEDHQMMKTNFDLSARIEQMLLGLEVVAFEKNIELKYNLLPEAMIYGNPEQLSQVMMILVDNAIKYTPEHGEINLTLTRSTHHTVVTLSNTGMGIATEDLPHVFDRFYRVDKVRSRDSNSYGLGLAIAKSIVEQHGGKISCESVPGGWTTFVVKLR